MNISTITQKRFLRFKKKKQAYWSLWLLAGSGQQRCRVDARLEQQAGHRQQRRDAEVGPRRGGGPGRGPGFGGRALGGRTGHGGALAAARLGDATIVRECHNHGCGPGISIAHVGCATAVPTQWPEREIRPWQPLSHPIDRCIREKPRVIRKTVVRAACRASIITVPGFGDAQPVALNDTVQGRGRTAASSSPSSKTGDRTNVSTKGKTMKMLRIVGLTAAILSLRIRRSHRMPASRPGESGRRRQGDGQRHDARRLPEAARADGRQLRCPGAHLGRPVQAADRIQRQRRQHVGAGQPLRADDAGRRPLGRCLQRHRLHRLRQRRQAVPGGVDGRRQHRG